MPSFPLSVQEGIANYPVTPSVWVTEDLLTERLNLMHEELRREFDDKLEKLRGLHAWVPLESDAGMVSRPDCSQKPSVTFREEMKELAKPVSPLVSAQMPFTNGMQVNDVSVGKSSYTTGQTEANLSSKSSGITSTSVASSKLPLYRYLLRSGTYSSRNVDEIEVEDAHLDCLAPTVWESTIFIGLPQVGVGGSILLFILLAANIAMQIMISFIIARTFPSEKLNLESMKNWRHMIGHHYSQVDTFGHSLVGRVCEGVETLSIAQGQFQVIDEARVYAGSQSDGPLLCTFCILIWFLIWLQEAERIVTIMREIWLVPSAYRTRVAVCDDRWSLETLSRLRKLFTHLVCVARMTVAIVLLVRGTFWLIYTVSVTELVLNAVALQFIFGIDELIYDIFTPKVVKTMLERLVIHVFASQIKGEHVYRKSLAGLAHVFAVLALIFLVVLKYIYPNTEHVREVIKASCGGKRNFAIGRHADLGILFYARTQPPKTQFDTDKYGWDAIHEIISNQSTSAAFVEEFGEFAKIMAKDASEVADDFMPSCHDSIPSELPMYWTALRRDLNLPEAASCEDVKQECGHATTHLVRMLCPGTCRCFYSRPSTAISKGCPYWRCQDNAATAGYYDETHSCDDDNVSVVTENPHWRSYWRSLHASKKAENRKKGNSFDKVARFALKYGCAVIEEYRLHREVCAELKDRHALGTYCPVACECPDNDYWGCPAHCR